MKKILKLFFIIFKAFFCLLMTSTFLYLIFIVNACAEHTDWQIICYSSLSLVLSVGIWMVLLGKFNKKINIIFWTLFLLYIFSPHFLPSVDMAFEHDNCMDKGGRWEYNHNKCDIQELKSK